MNAYLHIPDEPFLEDTVLHFWEADRCNTYFNRETILPKGAVEIIFNFCTDLIVEARLYEKPYTMPRCFIQAWHNRPIELTLPERQMIFGVSLHSTAVKYLFGIPAGEFAASCTDMTLVDSDFLHLWHQLGEQETFMDRTRVFSGWFKTRLPRLTPRERAFNQLIVYKTVQPVPQVCRMLCYSSRNLSRKFREFTGMNTEEALRYLKYLNALDLIYHSPQSLAQVAYASGFADQSHLHKTFRAFTALTPSDYRNRKSFLPGHLFDNVR